MNHIPHWVKWLLLLIILVVIGEVLVSVAKDKQGKVWKTMYKIGKALIFITWFFPY